MSIEEQKAITYKSFSQKEDISQVIAIINDFNRVKEQIQKL